MITLLFFILLFLVSLWPSSQTQIISSLRNLCCKHLLSGLCFEGNVAEKQILPEQRKEKTGTDDSPLAACLLHSIYCGGLWYCWLALLPCESLSKDPKRKVNRKFESEERAEWRRSSYHRKRGATSFPLRGCLKTPSLHMGVRLYFTACLLLSVYRSILGFLFSIALFFLQLARPFKITISALYHCFLPKSLSFSQSVVKAIEFLEYETNIYIYIYIVFSF